MNFNRHSELEGLHAFLGASKYHWINYDEKKVEDAYLKHWATLKGTELHALASELIRLGVTLPRTSKTLNMFVNDAIGFKMNTEQPLYFSPNCFGTADAISFKNNILRVHDLKTGVGPTSVHQLEVYAALFCLEYRIDPEDIVFELRIYQNDEILVHEPAPEQIRKIMTKIGVFDKVIEKIKAEA